MIIVILSALFVQAVIVWAVWKLGYTAGFAERYPNPSRECGHRLNPHQWSPWKVTAALCDYSCTPPLEKGIVQERTCSRCGWTDQESVSGVPRRGQRF